MSLRARWILIGVVSLLMVYLALPSFFSAEEREARWWLREDALTLGLDLQGGVHWLLSIDENTAIAQELERTASNVKDQAEEGKVALASAEVKGQTLELRGDLGGLRKLVEDLDTVDVTQTGDALVVELSDRWLKEVRKRGVDQALEVLRKRVDGLGVREPVIAPQGEGRILVQMPGVVDPAAARKVLEQTTFLEFKLVLDQAPTTELLTAKFPDGKVPEDQTIVAEVNKDGSEKEALLVPKKEILTGDMLEDARIEFDRRGRPMITFQWNNEGTRVFREFTGEHIGDRLAAIIDGKVITAPVIQSKIGRNGQITGDFTREEAANTAVQLRSGALPIPLVIEEERAVGPALGADSIRQGLNASLLGIALVFVFMAVYYSATGIFADIALVLNVLMVIALMSFSGATLTLPGIAGIVLTVGMAVDSNVIIYERIREELRSGKNSKAAIHAGFARSFWTIFDTHLTTLLSAVILILFGRGPVQGFGVTLFIGLVASMFTALVVTRSLIDLVYGENPQNLRV